MTCLKPTRAAPATVPVLLTLLQPLTAQAVRRIEQVLVGTLEASSSDAFDATVETADAAGIEYASWLADPGAIEMASWAAHLKHAVR